MMATPAATPEFSQGDRLGLALLGAMLAHMVVVFLVTFSSPPPAAEQITNLEITLVQTRSDEAPKDAQFLAQANQDGGGDSDLRETARSPLPVQELAEKNDALPTKRPPPQEQVASVRETPPVLAQPRASAPRLLDLTPRPEPQQAQPDTRDTGLIESDLAQERMRLSAEISRDWQAYQQRPRQKFINARTREYKYAAYMDAWRAKVERVGNLNYPDQAKRAKIAGNLVLDVALNADGSVRAAVVRRSSGHKVLDDAAVRIVELAAPFSPFPADIRGETDILHITRTWKFHEHGVRSTID
jgi:protein TonB